MGASQPGRNWMRSFMPPSRTCRRSGGGGAIWATGLPWRVMTTFSPFSTARISSGKRFLASAMLTSMFTIIAIIYGHNKGAGELCTMTDSPYAQRKPLPARSILLMSCLVQNRQGLKTRYHGEQRAKPQGRKPSDHWSPSQMKRARNYRLSIFAAPRDGLLGSPATYKEQCGSHKE